MKQDAHGGHSHDSHHHHHHGSHAGMVHEPSAETLEAYQRVYDETRPAAGRQIIKVDLDAQEIDWEFVPGVRTRAWGYNGTVPGPIIEGHVGDVLEVTLKNTLPEATMVHWHGIRLHAPMDGTENVQRPVEPGSTFTYRFLLRDAGTYWYHPHINETVQLERGLYGALIVRDDDEPEFDRERVLVLDDVALNPNGEIEPPGGWLEQHDGRQGSTLLVNGKSSPEFEIAAGQIERWRIINAASARYVRLSVGGTPFRIIGTDGGLLTAPVPAREVLLAPADRVELAVGPFAEGETIQVESLPYDRGAVVQAKQEKVATLRIGSPAPSHARIPDHLRVIEPLVTGTASPTREVRLGWGVSPEGVEFTINKETHHRAVPVRLHELQIWDVVNDSPIDHPFHLHGFFFQVVAINGNAPEFLSWEDTVNIPAKGRVRIAWLPEDRAGEWMYHCHILEHHAGGMMAHFEVVDS